MRPKNVTRRSPARYGALLSYFDMSFEDEAVEPLAVESAEHFAKLVRRAAGLPESQEAQPTDTFRERREPRRALPRELGN